jgi:hypothetical protein
MDVRVAAKAGEVDAGLFLPCLRFIGASPIRHIIQNERDARCRHLHSNNCWMPLNSCKGFSSDQLMNNGWWTPSMLYAKN